METLTTLTIKFIAVLSIVFGLTAAAQATPLVNGNFDTGDLTGWSTFTTTNGHIGPSFGLSPVDTFDTNNNGISSYSAQFRVGQATFEGFHINRGGGIFQMVTLGNGTLNIEADIASSFPNPGRSFWNSSGGLFELFLDGVLLDSYDFGDIFTNTTEYGILRANANITGGIHELRFQITRSALWASGVLQYIDNIELSGPAVDDIVLSGSVDQNYATTPEPSTMLLLGTGLASLVAWRKKQAA